MYIPLLHSHNLLRWLVLAAALFTIALALRGLIGQRAWGRLEHTTSLAFVISLDLQLVLGLFLFLLSPLVQTAIRNVSTAMSSSELRFFLVEHSLLMIIAVTLAHLGNVLVKRTPHDKSKFIRAFIWYGLTSLAMLVAIPWWRPLLPGG